MSKLLSLLCLCLMTLALAGCGPSTGTTDLNPKQQLDPIAPEGQIIDHG